MWDGGGVCVEVEEGGGKGGRVGVSMILSFLENVP